MCALKNCILYSVSCLGHQCPEHRLPFPAPSVTCHFACSRCCYCVSCRDWILIIDWAGRSSLQTEFPFLEGSACIQDAFALCKITVDANMQYVHNVLCFCTTWIMMMAGMLYLKLWSIVLWCQTFIPSHASIQPPKTFRVGSAASLMRQLACLALSLSIPNVKNKATLIITR